MAQSALVIDVSYGTAKVVHLRHVYWASVVRRIAGNLSKFSVEAHMIELHFRSRHHLAQSVSRRLQDKGVDCQTVRNSVMAWLQAWRAAIAAETAYETVKSRGGPPERAARGAFFALTGMDGSEPNDDNDATKRTRGIVEVSLASDQQSHFINSKRDAARSMPAVRPRYHFGNKVLIAARAACLLYGIGVGAVLANPIEDCANAADPREAVEGCTKIIASNWATDDQLKLAFNIRANANSYLGSIANAIDDYGRALALDPHYENARYNRGSLYLETRQFDLAISDFNGVIALAPDRADAYNNRGLAALESGRLDASIADFSVAIELDPSVAYPYNNRGVAWRRKGDLRRASADFGAAVDLFPEYTGARNNRGEVSALLGRSDLAEFDFKRVLEIDPKHEKARQNLRKVMDLELSRR
jgi:tetratricopeptide (TPR) repeat protein